MLGQVRAMELTDTDPMLLDSVIVSDSLFGLTQLRILSIIETFPRERS